MPDLAECRQKAAIELSLVPGFGARAQDCMWKIFPELSELLAMRSRELEAYGVASDAAEAISARRYRAMADEIFDWIHRENYSLLLRGAADYPALLSEIYDPPLLLYCRGDVGVLGLPCVAVVGTRRPTFYGLQVAQGLAYELSKRGLTVVSGLARGIDAAAHRGSLEAEGRTAAVFGCGIDVVYPREHQRLAQQISERGLVISEFPPGTSPAPQNFPVRNRIISGVSLGAVIVEASEYSGSLITARLAMEQNREVFAIPGNITSPQSFGPNYLIKQGAKLVQVWRDVVEELPVEVRHRILENENAKPDPKLELELMTSEESIILGLLAYDRAIQFDSILQKCGWAVPRLSEMLLDLEMRGQIRQVPGNLFVRIARRGK
jgi:DNA processing protein